MFLHESEQSLRYLRIHQEIGERQRNTQHQHDAAHHHHGINHHRRQTRPGDFPVTHHLGDGDIEGGDCRGLGNRQKSGIDPAENDKRQRQLPTRFFQSLNERRAGESDPLNPAAAVAPEGKGDEQCQHQQHRHHTGHEQIKNRERFTHIHLLGDDAV